MYGLYNFNDVTFLTSRLYPAERFVRFLYEKFIKFASSSTRPQVDRRKSRRIPFGFISFFFFFIFESTIFFAVKENDPRF